MRCLAFLLQVFFVSTAAAEDWPKQKAIHIVVGFAPASTTDLVARLVQPKLQEALGQSVIVENKPGAGGNVATQQVKRSAPDGYVLLVTSVAYAVNPSLYANAGYDPFSDFIPVILGPRFSRSVTPSSRDRKSRCHQSRLNSPSVMPCSPIASCLATASRMALC